VFEVLCSERFADQAPTTVHAKLLDEDQRYLCHPRTMYRILASGIYFFVLATPRGASSQRLLLVR
jgi:hypothetical protein